MKRKITIEKKLEEFKSQDTSNHKGELLIKKLKPLTASNWSHFK